jgi:hypothetical protein
MVSVGFLNDLRDAAQLVIDIAEDDQIDIGSEVWDKALAKLKALC